MNNIKEKKERIYGFDIIRLISFFAIATFHVSLIHYYTKDIAIAAESPIIRATEQFSRFFSFSGFTIIFLTSILTAFSGTHIIKRIRLFGFLCLGWCVFSGLMSGVSQYFLVWDIYPLIFLGVFICSVVERKSTKALYGLGLIGFTMLWIPFWSYSEYFSMPVDLKIVLGFADCDLDVSEWPIFPWIGLVWVGYSLGHGIRSLSTEEKNNYFVFSRKEAAIWAVFLLAGSTQFGAFFNINLGSFFACEAYRQPPVIWWGHFIYVLFAVRASLIPKVQEWLGQQRIIRWISQLAISRKFWLAYITNYLFAHVIDWMLNITQVELTGWNVPVIAFIAVFFLPMTEIVTRLIISFFSNLIVLKNKFSKN